MGICGYVRRVSVSSNKIFDPYTLIFLGGKIAMANRIVLNETSYHGAGAIKEIPAEVKTRGFKKADGRAGWRGHGL